MTCRGKEERDICPYRIGNGCFLYMRGIGRNENIMPCEKCNRFYPADTIGWIVSELIYGDSNPLTAEDIINGMREVDALLKR